MRTRMFLALSFALSGRLEQPVRAAGQVRQLRSQRRHGVRDRVGHGPDGPDRTGLADSLAAERRSRAGGDEVAQLDTASAPVMGDYPYGPGGSKQRQRRLEGGWE